MNKILTYILIITLMFSGFLLWKTYNKVDRWQEKGLRIAEEQKTPFNEVPKWLIQSPLVVAICVWLEAIKNIASLLISLVSAITLYFNYKRNKQLKSLKE